MLNSAMWELGSRRSCIRELFEYGQKRRREVGADGICDFSLGNPSIAPPAQVEQVLLELLRTRPGLALHGYTSAGGDAAARSAIAADLNRRFGAGVGPEDLFLGCGAAPELCSVIRALAVEQSEFVVIAPFFPEYRPFVESAGGKLRIVPADIPAFQIDFAALEQTLTPQTQALILNSPNNPSGTVYGPDTVTRLAALLREKSREFGHPIYLLSDEPYRELVYEGRTVPFLPHFYENTVICYSYSKSLSLPGERLGYLCVPPACADHDALLAAIAGAARSLGHVCAPALMQHMIAECAGLGPDLAAYDKNRRLLSEGLSEMGYEMARPDGAFYLFVKAPEGDSEAFSRRARERDLLVVPGTDFGCGGYFRLCYCVPEAVIRRSLPIFRELLP